MTSKLRTCVTILWIGLVAGTLDIGENLVFNQLRHITPEMVFRFIGSGLIGAKAARHGAGPVALGVVIHYAIVLAWTVIFYLLSRRLLVLTRRPVSGGLAYGGIVYLVMTYVVLPLTRVPHPRSVISIASRINAVLALLLCIGLIISLLVSYNLTPARKGTGGNHRVG